MTSSAGAGQTRRLAILACGSREWAAADAIALDLARRCGGYDDVVIIDGAARGADAAAGAWVRRAHAQGLAVRSERIAARWGEFGKRAGPVRNEQMLARLGELGRDGYECVVVAYKQQLDPSLARGGTEHMVRIARAGGFDTVVVDGCVEAPAGTDAWHLWDTGRWLVVPTNLQRDARGAAVMGAGLAKDVADRFPDIPIAYGVQTAFDQTRLVCGPERLLLVPTKVHWKDPSTIALVRESVEAVAAWQRRHRRGVVVPALGCGLGGLAWDQVRPVLVEALAGCDAVLIPPR